MTLSEAIRIGAAIRPQCHGAYFINGQSCAAGAAYEAYTGLSDEHSAPKSVSLSLEDSFPVARKRVLHCPGESCPIVMRDPCNGRPREAYVLDLVIHLNDRHHWTREQIADWVQGIEEGQ